MSPELKGLLWTVYQEIARRPTDLVGLRASLKALLQFLASARGRTNANCRATDYFFCFEREWQTSTEHLPEDYREVLPLHLHHNEATETVALDRVRSRACGDESNGGDDTQVAGSGGIVMSADPMELHGQALLDYLEGDQDATMLLHRDDGFTYSPLAAREWFYENGLPEFDRTALQLCRGVVLDAGAGSGSHSLALAEQGLDVHSLEVSELALEVMRRRDVPHPVQGSVFGPIALRVDTVLLLGNIGIVENLAGLDEFFRHLKTFLMPGGRLITDSVDPRNNEDARYVAYRRRRMAEGRYEGERTLRFEYRGRQSQWFEWAHIAFEPLAERAARAGFGCEKMAEEGRRFLCLLERSV